MDDIKLLFNYMFNDIDDPGDDIVHPEQVYTTFCKLKTICSQQLLDNLSEQMDLLQPELSNISAENLEQVTNLLLVLMLVIQANLCKKLADKIIMNKFA